MINRWLIHATLIMSLVLEIVPMPLSFSVYRPDWLMMALVFWNLFFPTHINVGVALIYGILLDILLGYSLGIHSLVLCLIVYFNSLHLKRIVNYSMWQQTFIIGLYGAFLNLCVFWLQHYLNDAFFHLTYFLPAIISMLFWPWTFWVLNKLRKEKLRS